MDFEESKIKWKSNLFYTFVLTNRCNYRCKHCLVEDYSGDIDFDLVVNNIKELHKIGVETISFTGGEVFLYEKWYEVFKLCNDLGINVSFVTNGSQFNEKSIDWLKKIRPGICFSLDGPEKFHNDYRGSDKAFMNVVKSIELVQACELPVTIYYTCYKQNLKYVDWIIDFCIDHNVKRLRIQPIEYVGNAKKNIKESDLLDDQDKIELLKKCIDSNGKNIGILNVNTTLRFREHIVNHSCGIGANFYNKCHSNQPPQPYSFDIEPNGDVYPYSKLINSQYVIGNLKDHNITQLVESYFMSEKHIQILNLMKFIFQERFLKRNNIISNWETDLYDLSKIPIPKIPILIEPSEILLKD